MALLVSASTFSTAQRASYTHTHTRTRTHTHTHPAHTHTHIHREREKFVIRVQEAMVHNLITHTDTLMQCQYRNEN